MAAFRAADVAEFVRDATGEWAFRARLVGHDADPNAYLARIGAEPGPAA